MDIVAFLHTGVTYAQSFSNTGRPLTVIRFRNEILEVQDGSFGNTRLDILCRS
jgi:hypothetical protein